MYLEKLALLHFRNYGELQIDFKKAVNVFIGDNGQGKTNLLEAISLLATGTSFRHGDTNQMVQESQEGALLTGAIRSDHVRDDVQIRLVDAKREVYLNRKKTSRGSLLKKFSTVVFSPESLAIVKAGPSERRSFFDTLILSLNPDRYTLLQDYQRALRARNVVLKDPENLDVLESLNPTFLFLATEVVMERLNVLKSVLPKAQEVLKNVLEYQSVDISVDYVISQQSAVDWDPNTVYDALRSRLRDLARAEIDSGQSLIGPHKHDLRFLFRGQDARTFCSQGQQRAIVLAFKIAQILLIQHQRGDTPFLLLDDVLSELDQTRRKNLLNVLSQLKSQIFMTSTELGVVEKFETDELSIFRITNGKLKEQG